jgi:hypothetical protein
MANQKVFIICPIGAVDSPERARSNELMEFVITPIAEELGYDVVRSDKISEPGRITAQIARELGSSDLVIADLTGLNPNVMYELGVRQGLELPYIQMALKGQQLPFDLLDIRTIFYELSLAAVRETQIELRSQMQAAKRGEGGVVSRALFSAPENKGADPTQQDLIFEVIQSNARILRELEVIRDQQSKAITVVPEADFSQEMMRQMLKLGMEDPQRLGDFIKLVQSMQSVSGSTEPPKVVRAGSTRNRNNKAGGSNS